MKKEEWINSVLETASEIREIDGNPFLYQKLVHQINLSKQKEVPSIKYKLSWAIAIFVLIALNISVLAIYKSKIHKQNETVAIEVLSKELNSNTIINY